MSISADFHPSSVSQSSRRRPFHILITAACIAGVLFASPAYSTLVSMADDFKVVLNGSDYLIDSFEDGLAPPTTEATISTFASGVFREEGGKVIMDSDYGRLILDRDQVVSTGATLFVPGDTVLTHDFRYLTNASDTDTRGLKIDDTFEVSAVFNLVEPVEISANYGIGLSDFKGAAGADDALRLSVLRRLNGEVGVSFFRFDSSGVSSGGAIVNTPIAFIPLDSSDFANHDSIVLKLSRDDTANNDIRASYAFVDGGVTGSFTSLTNTADATIFNGENWTRADLRQLDNCRSNAPCANIAELTTGSDVSISQQVTTSANPFLLSFNYLFGELVGIDLPELTVSLGGTVIDVITATDPVNPNFQTANYLIDDLLLLDQTLDLEFLLSGPTGSSIFLHAIFLQDSDLANGLFDDGLTDWTTMSSGQGSVSVIEIVAVAVPSPAPIALFTVGALAIGSMRARKTMSRKFCTR